jgi:hypothetical protein
MLERQVLLHVYGYKERATVEYAGTLIVTVYPPLIADKVTELVPI